MPPSIVGRSVISMQEKMSEKGSNSSIIVFVYGNNKTF